MSFPTPSNDRRSNRASFGKKRLRISVTPVAGPEMTASAAEIITTS